MNSKQQGPFWQLLTSLNCTNMWALGACRSMSSRKKSALIRSFQPKMWLVENSMAVPQKTKNKITIRSSNPTLGHIFGEKTVIWKDTCTPIFTAALLTIARTWKQPRCPLTDKWVKKMWYIRRNAMGYYSVIRKDKIMPFAATWLDLGINILSEISHKEKDKYHMTSLICRI